MTVRNPRLHTRKRWLRRWLRRRQQQLAPRTRKRIVLAAFLLLTLLYFGYLLRGIPYVEIVQ